MRALRTAGFYATVLSVLVACGDGPTPPQPPLSIRKAPTNSGDNQTDTVLATLAPFRILVERGTTPAQGVTVRWTLPSHASVPPQTTTTDASGIASLRLTFDGIPRTYTVLASVDGATGSPVTFTATATPGNTLGTLQLTTTTTGIDLPNGHQVLLQDASGDKVYVVVPANATTAIRLRPGDYNVSLMQGPVNCDAASPSSQTVMVPSGGSATAEFAVVCATPPLLAFASETDAEIYTIKLNGTAATRLTTGTGDGNSVFAWSPDGSKIVFASNRDGNYEIYVMNADGSGQTRLTNDPGPDQLGSWLPDGRKIAFLSGRDGNDEIYVMNADGSGQTRLTNDPGPDRFGSWSPDGGKIVFTSGRDGNSEIYVMNADGSVPVRLTHDPGYDGSPRWSPHGGKIAFTSNRDGAYDIYVMNADGTSPTRLTSFQSGLDVYSGPAWSPDGTKLAFSHVTGTTCFNGPCSSELVVMNADGSGVTLRSSGASPTNRPGNHNTGPVWSPDSRWIAFTHVNCDPQYYGCDDSYSAVQVVRTDGSYISELVSHAFQPAWRP